MTMGFGTIFSDCRYMISFSEFRRCLLPVILFLTLFSCAPSEERQVVARVNDKYLYFDEMAHIFPDKVTREDSTALAQLFVENWIKTQLLLDRAELNLSEEQMSITKEIEAYRSSLLVFRYKESMVKAKLDTAVSDQDLEAYYEANKSNFVQAEDLIKGVFVKLPLSAPKFEQVRNWMGSVDEKDIRDLDNYCYTFASKYDYFDDDWVALPVVQAEFPEPWPRGAVMTPGLVEQSDSAFRYFVYVRERLNSGEIAPLNQVRSRVRDVILNKRKMELLTSLEQDIYQDALQKKLFEIYPYDKP